MSSIAPVELDSHGELRRAAEQLLSLSYSLKELSELTTTEPGVTNSDREFHAAQMKLLSREQRRLFHSAVRLTRDMMEIAFGSFDDSEEGGEKSLLQNIPAGISLRRLANDSAELIVRDPMVRDAYENFMWNTAIGFKHRGDHQDILLRSLLTTAVSGFEILILAVFKYILRINPALISESDHVFTLRELEGFADLKEARESLVERKAESFVAGGIDEWKARFAKGDVRISLEDLVENWTSVREVFARRNIIVHNDALVDSKYRSILRNAKVPDADIPALLTKLEVSPDYLRVSIEMLAGLAVRLVMKTVSNFGSASAQVDQNAQWLRSQHIEMMQFGFWETILATTHIKSDFSSVSRQSSMLLQRNRWIALAELGYSDQLRSELDKWDSSGLSLEFAHVKHVLTNDQAAYMDSIKKLLSAGSLSLVKLFRDPLYRSLRESGALNSFFQEAGSDGDRDMDDDG